jgi:hypothetical protein
MSESFASLRLLFGGYLNLDWIDDYDDPWDAVSDFAASEPSASDLPGEVGVLLSSQPQEPELRHVVVDELGSGYLPESDGWRYDEWLAELAARVREATQT